MLILFFPKTDEVSPSATFPHSVSLACTLLSAKGVGNCMTQKKRCCISSALIYTWLLTLAKFAGGEAKYLKLLEDFWPEFYSWMQAADAVSVREIVDELDAELGPILFPPQVCNMLYSFIHF